MRLRNVLPVLALLASSALAMAQGSPSPAQGQKWALLVGIDEYENDLSPLRYAVADVKAVSAALIESGGYSKENVVVMTSDLPKASIDRPTNVNVLKRLDFLASKMGPNDTFLFYFSGHGFGVGGNQFLATVNADRSSAEMLQLSALPLSLLRDRMARIQASQVVFIIDACRNDPEPGRGESDNKLTQDLARDLVLAAQSGKGGAKGAAVLFACAAGERAYEWDEKNQGAFTYFLLEGLKGGGAERDGSVTIYGLASFVQQRMARWSDERGKRQTPDLKLDGAARIVVARSPVAATAATPTRGNTRTTTPAGRVDRVNTKAKIRVRTTPPGAAIFIDGQQVPNRVTPAELEVELGIDRQRQFEVGVRLEGYQDSVKTATVARGGVVTVEHRLSARPARHPSDVPSPSGSSLPAQNDELAARGKLSVAYRPPVGRVSEYSLAESFHISEIDVRQNTNAKITRRVLSGGDDSVQEELRIEHAGGEVVYEKQTVRRTVDRSGRTTRQDVTPQAGTWIAGWIPADSVAVGDSWAEDFQQWNRRTGAQPTSSGTLRAEVVALEEHRGVQAVRIRVRGDLREKFDQGFADGTITGDVWIELETGELIEADYRFEGKASVQGVELPFTSSHRITRQSVR